MDHLYGERAIDVLRREGEVFGAAARRGLDPRVPTCPEWTMRDLVQHLGMVHRQKAEQVRGRHQERVRAVETPPTDDDTLLEWYDEGLARLLDVLSSTDPAEPVWSWRRDDRKAGFWRRRMVHETTVHRVDAQTAFGEVTHVDDDVATDGVDEVLAAFLVAFSRRDVGGDGRTVAVRTGERIWRVTPLADRVDLERAPGPSEATVSGEPSELYLWLWGRRPDGSVRMEGEASLAHSLRALIARLT